MQNWLGIALEGLKGWRFRFCISSDNLSSTHPRSCKWDKKKVGSSFQSYLRKEDGCSAVILRRLSAQRFLQHVMIFFFGLWQNEQNKWLVSNPNEVNNPNLSQPFHFWWHTSSDARLSAKMQISCTHQDSKNPCHGLSPFFPQYFRL